MGKHEDCKKINNCNKCLNKCEKKIKNKKKLSYWEAANNYDCEYNCLNTYVPRKKKTKNKSKKGTKSKTKGTKSKTKGKTKSKSWFNFKF